MTDTPPLPSRETRHAQTRYGKPWVRALRWSAFAIVVWFVSGALCESFAQVEWSEIELDFRWMALACGSFVAAQVLRATAFRSLLGRVAHTPRWPVVLAVSWIAWLGKFLPGKVMTVVGAAYLLKRRGVSATASAAVAIISNGLAVLIGFMVAFPLVFYEPIVSRVPLAWLAGAIVLIGGAAGLHPKVFGWAANLGLRAIGRKPLRRIPCLRDYAIPLVLVFLNRCAIGFAFWCTTRVVTYLPLSQIPFYIGASGLAGTLGLLALFAPGGLGIREGALLFLLRPVLGDGTAGIVTVATRFLQVLSTVIMGGVGLVILKIMGNTKGQPAPPDQIPYAPTDDVSPP